MGVAVCVESQRVRVTGPLAICRARSGALVRRRHGHGLVCVWRRQEHFLHDGPSGMCRAMCRRGLGSSSHRRVRRRHLFVYKPTFWNTLKSYFFGIRKNPTVLMLSNTLIFFPLEGSYLTIPGQAWSTRPSRTFVEHIIQRINVISQRVHKKATLAPSQVLGLLQQVGTTPACVSMKSFFKPGSPKVTHPGTPGVSRLGWCSAARESRTPPTGVKRS